MRLRHGVVVASSPGSATVELDGAEVTVPVSSDQTLEVGTVADLLHDGRRLVALSSGYVEEPTETVIGPPVELVGSVFHTASPTISTPPETRVGDLLVMVIHGGTVHPASTTPNMDDWMWLGYAGYYLDGASLWVKWATQDGAVSIPLDVSYAGTGLFLAGYVFAFRNADPDLRYAIQSIGNVNFPSGVSIGNPIWTYGPSITSYQGVNNHTVSLGSQNNGDHSFCDGGYGAVLPGMRRITLFATFDYPGYITFSNIVYPTAPGWAVRGFQIVDNPPPPPIPANQPWNGFAWWAEQVDGEKQYAWTQTFTTEYGGGARGMFPVRLAFAVRPKVTPKPTIAGTFAPMKP